MSQEAEKVGTKRKSRLIGFRVDEDIFTELENRAILAGKSPADWCRDELTARLSDGIPFTANEELIHADILRFGRMTMRVFDLVVKDKLTKENWQKVLDSVNDDRKEIGQKYFASLMAAASKSAK
jgi:hypothetical protein